MHRFVIVAASLLTCFAAAPGPTPVTQLDVSRLRAALSSPQLLRTAVSYIVTPARVSDVVAAVQFAADHGLKASARGTGHQLSGVSLPAGGVLIDMADLKQISSNVTARTATAQMGAKSGDVARATVPQGFVPIIGTCQDVGVAGFTLQGGSGWASAYNGPASDNVLSLDVITVGANRTAVIATVTAQSDPELFFGLRGGAPLFGIVVSMTVRTFAVPKTMTKMAYTYPLTHAQDVLAWWVKWVAQPPIFGNAVQLGRSGALGQTATVETFVLTDNSTDVVAKLYAQAAFENSTGYLQAVNITQMPTVEFMGNNYFCGILDGDYTKVAYWNSYYTRSHALPPGFIATLVDQLNKTSDEGASFSLYLSPSATPAGQPASSYGFRNALQLDVQLYWARTAGGAAADGDAQKIGWVKNASVAAIPFTAGRYANQLMYEFPDDARASYEPATWARLVALKPARDPLNLFRDLDYTHKGALAPAGLAPAPAPAYLGQVAPGMAPSAVGAPTASVR